MRPNILIFLTDQQQGRTVSADHPCRTPHARRLADQGLTFTSAYCPTAHCCPSRATFHTGLYPSRHGIWNNVSTPTALNRELTPGVSTFGAALHTAGYQLAFSGKWHVSGVTGPADHGWEELLVRSPPGAPSQAPPWQIIQSPDAALREEARARGTIDRPGWRPIRLYRTDEDGARTPDAAQPDRQVIDAALDALPRLAEADRPWCLFVGPHNPHDPFIAPRHFVEMYDPARVELPRSFRDNLGDKPGIYRRMRRQLWDQLGEDEAREAIVHYWAKCTMADAWLGELLDALDRTGQAENTLVLLLSDHGDYAGAHGLFLKGVPAFDEAYHIPCIARWPAGIAAPGRAVDEFVTLADFAPTFLELAGVPAVPSDFTGRSLLPFLRGETIRDWPRYRHTQFSGVELYYTQRSIADREFKYVYNGFDEDELYDLRSDPDEMVNRAGDRAYDNVKRRLSAEMWRFAAEQGDERIFNSYGTVALAPFGPGVASAPAVEAPGDAPSP